MGAALVSDFKGDYGPEKEIRRFFSLALVTNRCAIVLRPNGHKHIGIGSHHPDLTILAPKCFLASVMRF